MGRRSRKRSVAGHERTPSAEPVLPHAAAPPPAPATLRRRAPAEERPPAPWGAFPLGELTTLAGIVLLIVGFASKDGQLVAVGLALVALSATELAIREHFAGFRSHSSLLALAAGGVTGAILYFAAVPRALQIGLAVAVFAGTFLLMRRAFQRRAGGLGFRA